MKKGNLMTDENLFVVVDTHGHELLGETKHNYFLPIADVEAMCILLNYVLRNGDIPNTDTIHWWKKEEFKEYLRKDKMETSK